MSMPARLNDLGSWATTIHHEQRKLPLIIAWEHGTDQWRESILQPEQSHSIALTPLENRAMIQGLDCSRELSVPYANCNPHVIQDK